MNITRKALWIIVGCLLVVPHAICLAAAKADEWIMDTGSKMHRWSHPDMYAPRLPKRGPAPELSDEWESRES